MPRINRETAIPDDTIGVHHCFNRCVQQMTLCGQDPLTGEDRSGRKVWMTEMLEEMAGSFALDFMAYSFMGNHYHLLIRNRPDLASGYDNVEVALRWWRACPGIRGKDMRAAEPDLDELKEWIDDPKVNAVLRYRLSSVSWMMQLFNARIARRANAESGRKGHFFEGRFRSKHLLEEASILACSLYVDMNPIRAALAQTPEQSLFTSVNDRIVSRGERLARALRVGCTNETIASFNGLSLDVVAADPNSADAFLVPLTLEAEKRFKTHLEMSFPDTGPIAWATMDELRKNAASYCDESLKCLQDLWSKRQDEVGDGLPGPTKSGEANRPAEEAQSITSPSSPSSSPSPSSDAGAELTAGVSAVEASSETASRILKRPRPWHASRKTAVSIDPGTNNSNSTSESGSVSMGSLRQLLMSDRIVSAAQCETPEESTAIKDVDSSNSSGLSGSGDPGDSSAYQDFQDSEGSPTVEGGCEPSAVSSPEQEPGPPQERRDQKSGGINAEQALHDQDARRPALERVKVPALQISRKRRKAASQGLVPGTAKRSVPRLGAVHWLDRRGEASLRADPDDLSARLPFPSTRASNKGFMFMTLNEYIELLDWTGRQLVPDKKGAIPESEPPILARLGVKADGFIALIREMKEFGGVAMGSAAAMEAEARRVGQKWLHNTHKMDDVFR